MAGGRDDDSIVLIPLAPGALVWPGARSNDGLDDLIDELLPDTDEGPGLTDAALVAGGGALVAWSVVGSPPVAATVAGAVALGLGCILPARALWRRAVGRRRNAGMIALRVDDPGLYRLATIYAELDVLATTTAPVRAAAHGALLEVATLLDRRTPGSEGERRYVEARLRAVEGLVGALKALDVPDVEGPSGPLSGAEGPSGPLSGAEGPSGPLSGAEGPSGPLSGAEGPSGPLSGAEGPSGPLSGADEPPTDLVVEAREELDAIGGVSALSRIDDLTTEIRARGRRP